MLLQNNSYLNPTPDVTPQRETAREISLQSFTMADNQLSFVSSLNSPLKINPLVWFENLMNIKFIITSRSCGSTSSHQRNQSSIAKKVIKSDGILYFS